MSKHNELSPSPIAASNATFGLEKLMDITELATYLGVPISTVYDWRVRGKGPVAYRFGKHLKFAVSDVQAWVAEQRESSKDPSGFDRR